MKYKGLFLSIIACAIAITGSSQATSLKDLLPDPAAMNGWKFSREPEYYAGDELFDLIDGGADLYYEYDFVKVVNAQFSEGTGNKVQLEIYEMKSDSSAYGIFSSIYNTPDVSSAIGLYSVVNDQYIAFVKDRYYVNIAWVLKKDAHQESLMHLARTVEEKIGVKGEKPALIRQLCKEKCAGIPIYFRGNIALSNVYYFDFKDHFQIEQGVAMKDLSSVKIVFVYGNNGKAQQVFPQVRGFIESSKRFMDAGMIYQGFSCSDNKGNRLVFRLGQGYIMVMVALKPDFQLMAEQESFFNMVGSSLRSK